MGALEDTKQLHALVVIKDLYGANSKEIDQGT